MSMSALPTRFFADECLLRTRSADRCRWPHALYRERTSCRTTSSFTGCRDVQPGRPRARNRQMGFRDRDSEGEPKGRVYRTLPREMLATDTEMQDAAPLMSATQRVKVDPACNRRGGADFRAGATATHHHCDFGSESQNGGGAHFANDALDIPAVPTFPRPICLSADHLMHMGYAPSDLVRQADAIAVLECDVLWFPISANPRNGAAGLANVLCRKL